MSPADSRASAGMNASKTSHAIDEACCSLIRHESAGDACLGKEVEVGDEGSLACACKGALMPCHAY